jgi:hypothetical protein
LAHHPESADFVGIFCDASGREATRNHPNVKYPVNPD